METVANLFQNFINDTDKDELLYCLSQSSVEPIVRFKFGAWLSRKYPTWINAIETKRIDFIIGNEKEIFFIEFGHCGNMLGHTPENHEKYKIKKDHEKLAAKISSFSSNYSRLVQERTIHKYSISLFSDFKFDRIDKKYVVRYEDKPNFGVFLKYGTSKRDISYYNTLSDDFYIEKLRNYKYEEVKLADDKISLWWHVSKLD